MVSEAFQAFDFNGALDAYIPLWDNQMEEEAIKETQTHFKGAADCEDFNPFTSDLGSYAEKSFDEGVFSSNDLRPLSELIVSDTMQSDAATRLSFQELMALEAGQECNQTTQFSGAAFESEEKKANPISLTSLEILNSFRTGNRMQNSDRVREPPTQESPRLDACGRRSSAVEIMRTAGTYYIQLFEKMDDDLCKLGSPYNSMFSYLATEETKGIQLAYILLSSAEKIHNGQFDRASRLLEQCEALSSHNGDAVQRVVSYFVVALRERINRETGRMAMKGRWKKEILEEERMRPSSALLACHQQLPFCQVVQFTSTQAIIDNVASSRRVHLIDLSIGIGLQWSILMHALAERKASPIELLKITAVGTSKDRLAETGKRLIGFAQMLNLPFEFKSVVVSDMKDLKVGMFEVASDEAVAVYAATVLWKMIVRPDCLENLMRVIRALNPCVISVVEIEANHNSTSFVNRFTEALFFFSAWFDCVDTCMDRNDCNRLAIEGSFFFVGIRGIVAVEGSERTVRHVKLDVWRAYFERFGFVEAELSELSLYQANLLVKQFGCGNHCTFEMSGKGLVIGWKGTPLHCISAWKVK